MNHIALRVVLRRGTPIRKDTEMSRAFTVRVKSVHGGVPKII